MKKKVEKTELEKKLEAMLRKNPLRKDLNKRYQEIIKEYNYEKNRSTIEKTFAELMKLVNEMTEEEKRAAREGLDEEKLALFDLLLKPEISKTDREKVKAVSAELLECLKQEALNVEKWREKEATKAAVKTLIYNHLYDDSTGLPAPFYTDSDVIQKVDIVFDHVFMQYQDAQHNAYV